MIGGKVVYVAYLEVSTTPTRQLVWNSRHCIRRSFGDTELHLITNTDIAQSAVNMTVKKPYMSEDVQQK